MTLTLPSEVTTARQSPSSASADEIEPELSASKLVPSITVKVCEIIGEMRQEKDGE